MKWIKRSVTGSLVLVFFLLLAAVAVVITFDPNDYKPRIAALIEQHTGQAVRFDGDIELSLFPYIGAEVTGLALMQPEPFSTLTGRDEWLRAERVEAHAALLPLLRGEFEIGTLKAEGVDAHILHLADGRSNLDGLRAKRVADDVQPPGRSSPSETTPAESERIFSIGGIEVKQASIDWEDRQRGQRVRLSELDLTSGAIAPEQTTDLQLSRANLDYQHAEFGLLSARLSGQTAVLFEREPNQWALTGLLLEFSPRSLSLHDQRAGWPVPLGDYRLSGDLYLSMDDALLQAKNLHLQGDGLRSDMVAQMRLSVHTALTVNLKDQNGQLDRLDLELGGRDLDLERAEIAPARADAFSLQGGWSEPVTLSEQGALDLPAMDWQLSLRDWYAEEITAENQPARADLSISLAGVVLSAERELSAESIDTRLQAQALPGLAQLDAHLQTGIWADLTRFVLQTHGLLVDAELTLADEQQPALSAQYRGDLNYDRLSGRIGLPEVALVVNQAELAANVVFDDLAAKDAWSASGHLALAELDLAQMLAQWGNEMPMLSSDALRELAFSSDFQADRSSFEFDEFELLLDGQTVNGDLTLLRAEPFPAIRASLHSPVWSVNDYLPEPRTTEVDAASAARADKQTQAPLLPQATRAWLGDLDAEIDARIKTLTYQQWDLSDFEVRFQAADGLITVPELNLLAFDGRLDANASLDIQGDQPVMASRLDVRGMEIEPLLTLLGMKPRVSGKGNLQADLTTSGNDHDDLIANLAGTTATRLEDGVVQGVDLGYWLRRANAQIRGGDVTAVNRAETDFSALTASAVIESGIVHSDDLDLRAPLFRVSGDGQFNLPAEQIDYRAAASVVGSLEGQSGRDLQELRGITVPVLITGRFDSPQVRLDMERILRDATQDKVRERIDRELDRHLEEDAPVRELLDRFLR